MMRSRAVRKRFIASDGQLLRMYHRGTPEGFDSIARTNEENCYELHAQAMPLELQRDEDQEPRGFSKGTQGDWYAGPTVGSSTAADPCMLVRRQVRQLESLV